MNGKNTDELCVYTLYCFERDKKLSDIVIVTKFIETVRATGAHISFPDEIELKMFEIKHYKAII